MAQEELLQNCPDVVQSFSNIQIQQLFSSSGKRCYLRIHPRDAVNDLIYRDYLLTNDGLFLVFNSFSKDFSNTSDGAREFFFYQQTFNGFSWLVEDSSLILNGFGKKIFKFSLKTAQLESLSDAVIQVADKVIPENRGGVEILQNAEPFIDAGFQLGQPPSSNRKNKSVLRNSKNDVCTLLNTRIFDYTNDTVYLKPLTQVQKAFTEKCPGFVWK